MSRTLSCLFLLTVLLAGGSVAARSEAGPGAADGYLGARDGATAVLAADILDTSWGDENIRPSL
ncbi:hypothetical protein J7F03_05555 [Streptomyces sp. ISL-43]|uniref:hypothetical protein n=1 Tax=Streptomyces sp. ISL-43 TaxID=2819183 RepID=UPI001BE868DB|nr:hypothetical protein [Streptomyces sp. ISL-43]MBT2446556.1 hypothetical protein [Streptomyces sp. ISL-43]